MDRAETPRRVFRVRRPDAQDRLRLLALTLTLLAAPLLIVDNLPHTPNPGDGVELDAVMVADVGDTATTAPAAEPAQPVAAETSVTEAPPTTEAPVATTSTTAAPTTTAPPKTTTTTAPPPPPAPAPAIAPADVWYRLAQCESGGNWAHQGSYHGGLQFHPSTWVAYGGQEFAPYAYLASAGQQIAVAERILASHGGKFTAWPGCRAKLGLP
jgi:hypothetical protein